MGLAPDGLDGAFDRGLLVAGVDEAGRGPLAGPVAAAAVILDPARPIAGLDDSKRLTPARRAVLETEIQGRALAWSVAYASASEIDRVNILQASLLAMRRAVAALDPRPLEVLVDGNRTTDFGCAARAIVGGDGLVPAIGAASILAKVARDRLMARLELEYPGYGFAGHKGYPTAAHREALVRLGPCPEHRLSFAPVRAAVGAGERPRPWAGPLSRLPRAQAAWDREAFPSVLADEVQALGVGALPLSRLSDTGYVLETGLTVEVIGSALVEGRIQARLRVWFQQIAVGCSCGFEAEPEPAMGELLACIDRETGAATFLPVSQD